MKDASQPGGPWQAGAGGYLFICQSFNAEDPESQWLEAQVASNW
jgi:hypothetical protein